MAPKQLKVPKKKPALEDLDKFENSRHLTQVMHDTLAGEPPRFLCEGRGEGVNVVLTVLQHYQPGLNTTVQASR
jgi:hypothetical protein